MSSSGGDLPNLDKMPGTRVRSGCSTHGNHGGIVDHPPFNNQHAYNQQRDRPWCSSKPPPRMKTMATKSRHVQWLLQSAKCRPAYTVFDTDVPKTSFGLTGRRLKVCLSLFFV